MSGASRCTMALAALASVALLSACAEKAQELPAKSAEPSWQGADNPYVADGWKPGDQASWEEQMRRRAQGQNEYARIGGGAS